MITQKTKDLCDAACKLSRDMDRHACAYTDDLGNWKSKKAKAEYGRMDRRLQKLDAEYDASLAEDENLSRPGETL